MSEVTEATEETTIGRAGWQDYLEMCKPKVVALMLLTSVIGMFLSTSGMVPLDILVFGNLGIAMAAGSAAAVNHIIDRQIDLVMARTHNRPLAQGRVKLPQAIMFAALVGVAGIGMLALLINFLTAWLTLASLIGYAFIYSGFLKRATPQNITIGGLPGAVPPLLGWTSVTGTLDPNALLLVLIIFAWTPPHFWALAIHRQEEYAKVKIPMLPVTHGERFTVLHIMLYTLIMIAVSLLPFVTGMSGLLYLVSAVVLGMGFLYWAIILIGGKNPQAPLKTFRYSITYLMVLFLAMLIDHYL
jgi:heme o synthase